MFDELVIIAVQSKVNATFYKLAFDCPPIAKDAQPGQFLLVQIEPKAYDPLLRRPLGIYNVKGSTVEILYHVVGRGTQRLSEKKPGEELKIMGPAGHGFSLWKGRSILVAGGIGVAPLVLLAQKLSQPTFLVGAKSKDHLLPENEIPKNVKEVIFTTDDGSFGERGMVVEIFEQFWKKEKPGADTRAFVCGPPAMIRAILPVCSRLEVQGEASVEEHMACGVGACLGCMVKTKSGQKTCCKDGPVFDIQEFV